MLGERYTTFFCFFFFLVWGEEEQQLFVVFVCVCVNLKASNNMQYLFIDIPYRRYGLFCVKG